MSEFFCKGDCGEVFFYKDNEPLCILTCKKQLENDEKCDECFVEVKE